jgi:hypothetical protein
MGTSKIQKQVDDKLGKCIAVTAVHFHVCAVDGVFEAVAGEAGEGCGCTQVAAPCVDFHPAKLEKRWTPTRSTCSTSLNLTLPGSRRIICRIYSS